MKRKNRAALDADSALHGALMDLPVFDTHTHLVGGKLAARTFWDIGEYLWLLEELVAAGYPRDAETLSPKDRCAAYARAFNATSNTSMNWVVRQIMKDLYKLEITGAESVRAADEAVRQTAGQTSWPQEAVERMNVRRIAVNQWEHSPFPELPEMCLWFPRLDGLLLRRVEEIRTGGGDAAGIEAAAEELRVAVDKVKEQGAPGVMTTLPRLERRVPTERPDLKPKGNDTATVLGYLLHTVCEAAARNRLFVQLFLGIERGITTRAAPVNDPDRIVNLFGLFETHPCAFELVLGSEINNLDAVQTARIFPNVRVGGLWWYNFRVSSYRDCAQKRLEALPPNKCSFVVSDARCIEWCYGKVLLIKKLIAGFLVDQVQQGWIDEEEALRCAREWLHDSAARAYLKSDDLAPIPAHP